MHRDVLRVFVFLILAHSTFAQSLGLDWAVALNSQNSLYTVFCADIEVDSLDNSYVTGYFKGTVDFDPGLSTYNLTSNGDKDVFILKLDPDGNLVWVHAIGGSWGDDEGTAIALDSSSNIYCTGYTSGNTDFDPGLATSFPTYYGAKDVFILKLNSSGQFLWVKTFGGQGGDLSHSIAIGPTGNIVTAGTFSKFADFDPGPGLYSMSVTLNSSDIFIHELSPLGDFNWVAALGGSGYDAARSVKIDDNGYVYCTGVFVDSVDFDPDTGSFILDSGSGTDAFVMKLTPSGSFSWAFSLGDDTSMAQTGAIDIDQLSNVYVTGGFAGQVDFDPGLGVEMLESSGIVNLFLLKVDSNAIFQWVTATDTNYPSRTGVLDILVEGDTCIYICGDIWGPDTVDFDCGPGTSLHATDGFTNAFLAKYDTSGALILSRSFGSQYYDSGKSLAIGASGNLYMTGKFNNDMDADPGPGEVLLISNVGGAFFQRYQPCSNKQAIDSIVVCDSVTWIDGVTYTKSSDSSNFLIPNMLNCDSLVSLHLTVLHSTYYTDSISVCDSMVWINGTTYHENNYSATHILTNEVGCDSVVQLALNVLSHEQIDSVSTCQSYTWIDSITYYENTDSTSITFVNANGCDSIINLHLTIHQPNTSTDTIIACESYTWINGITYYDDNYSDKDTLLNQFGCDSVVTLNLTISDEDSISEFLTVCDSLAWFDGNTYYSDSNGIEHTLTNINGCDSSIILNLNILQSSYTIDHLLACDSLTWVDGETYYNINDTSFMVLSNSVGCDSVIHLDLIIFHPDTVFDTIAACDSLTWIDGETYYSDTLGPFVEFSSSVGCDSTVFLDLKIHHSIADTEIVVVCDSINWINGTTYYNDSVGASDTLSTQFGCDSIIFLDLSILFSSTYIDQLSSCDSLTWIDGNTYFQDNNTAVYVIDNSLGCDSSIHLDLVISDSYDIIDSIVTCDNYMWVDGNTYNSNNTSATANLTSLDGCDSTVLLNLEVRNSSYAIDSIIGCSKYTWIDGNTYSSPNNSATWILTNNAGCDSIVTLNLTLNESTSATDVQVACDSLTWIDGNTYLSNNISATHQLTNNNGCDSVVTLNLTVLESTQFVNVISACGPHTWIDGNTYSTNNNSAIQVLTNDAGCDSVIMLDLMVTIIDTTISVGENLLISGESEAASYQWLFCDSNVSAPLIGETDQSITPHQNGSFMVIITKDGCIDTSNCSPYYSIGTAELDDLNRVQLFPNPTDDFVIIKFEEQTNFLVNVYNAIGQLVLKERIESESYKLQLGASSGIFLIQIEVDGIQQSFRIVKEHSF